MSYGSWKALHPHTGEEQEPVRKKVVEKFCGICGAQLDKAIKKYCSPECSCEAAKARGREFAQRKREGLVNQYVEI